ncbi:phage tail protein [Streptococcus chenjunshii]|uniref:Phage tail protein n=1 Tax=Streptococcus chenjunshii TaxID=2173853 RepID=A0A372KML9_9STRE|nr:major tail protein [Streptococcus chenjunshii]AXQ79425.1 phage tail protein [Streptococcus chenjunshii]RFU51118.1 phage tail protein [Streptococcus chenjunshii]RFU53216.1 phage tail protein [Streptococcus chenjunshii]
MSLVGFKKMEIRVLDGKEPTENENVFSVAGVQDKGATQTANITGLTSEPQKTYGSDVAYFSTQKGVGDVKAELGLIDLPFDLQSTILGRAKGEDGVVTIGADTTAPFCSLTLFSTTAQGEEVAIGFFKGQFSMESIEIETLTGENPELKTESLTFTALASDDGDTAGQYVGIGVGKATVDTLRQKVKLTAAA